jgi:hypothetical protein
MVALRNARDESGQLDLTVNDWLTADGRVPIQMANLARLPSVPLPRNPLRLFGASPSSTSPPHQAPQ